MGISLEEVTALKKVAIIRIYVEDYKLQFYNFIKMLNQHLGKVIIKKLFIKIVEIV